MGITNEYPNMQTTLDLIVNDVTSFTSPFTAHTGSFGNLQNKKPLKTKCLSLSFAFSLMTNERLFPPQLLYVTKIIKQCHFS